MEELSEKLDSIMVELNKEYKEKYPNKGYLDKKVIDVVMEKTKKIQIFTIGEKPDIESDVVFTLEKKENNIVVKIPFINSQLAFPFDENFYKAFYQKSIEILCSKEFERWLNVFYRPTYLDSSELITIKEERF